MPPMLFAAGRTFLRGQACPGGEMAAGFEHRRVDLDGQCQRDNWADARYGDQTLAELAGFVRGAQFGVDFLDTGLNFVNLPAKKDEHLHGLRRYGRGLFNSREQRHDLSRALGGDDAELSGVTTHRVDQSDTLADQCLTYLQDHTLGLLPDGFHRHVMHAWSPGGLADRFGVVAIVFAAFDIGFDVLRWDETYRVAERGQFAGPIVRAATGFQGNNGGWKLLEERHHLRATKVDAQERSFLLINACKVNTALDVSMPIRLYWVMDGSGFGYSQSQFWHSMPWGRPPQQF